MVDRFGFRTCLWAGGAALLLIASFPGAAWAHTGIGATHGFSNGFAHPIFGWDHLLAMMAVGIWAAQRGGKAIWLLPFTFVATMALGGILGVTGIPLPGVEAGILASVLVLGALIAVAARFPLGAGMALVALFAIFHGHAHGNEMPQAASALGYSLGFCAATTLLHASGVAVPALLRRVLGEQQIRWVRFAGAGIGLAGVVLLLG